MKVSSFCANTVNAGDTGAFSALVAAYLHGDAFFEQLLAYRPDWIGLSEAIAARSLPSSHRHTLVEVLKDQYRELEDPEGLTAKQIEQLADQHCFTVCTAHQPNIGTGYLYFIYKIIHAIRLAEELNKRHPQNHVVPVYYVGAEDHDLEELGTIWREAEKMSWNGAGQQGAVGRMKPTGLPELFWDMLSRSGPPGETWDALNTLLRDAYTSQPTVAAATRYLVHQLFGAYGLLVVDGDDARLKQLFVPVMEAELFSVKKVPRLEEVSTLLRDQYKTQAHSRDINLFYLTAQSRERIVRNDQGWQAGPNADVWDEDTLRRLLKAHPEQFSPNVILRPLYQESILPNVAFIGGGSEVAYWMQLKPLFDFFQIPYPVLLLRQSVLVVDEAAARLQEALELPDEALFQPVDTVIRQKLEAMQTLPGNSNAWEKLKALREETMAVAAAYDPTLEKNAAATFTKMEHLMERLDKKMLQALKRREGTTVARIQRLHQMLYPEGVLQERRENFIPYYLRYGDAFVQALLKFTDPLQGSFLILKEGCSH